jgi:predicted PurR-regulated permease PerM
MVERNESLEKENLVQKWAIEAALRIALLAVLLVWCVRIMQPFIDPIVWGAIIAAALYPLFLMFRERALGGRNKVAAVLFTLMALTLLLWPTVNLTLSSAASVERFATKIDAGELDVPPPPESVMEWPLIGESTYSAWQLASQNMDAALEKYNAQIKQLGAWMLSMAAGAGVDLLKFVLAVVVAGVFMANGPAVVAAVERVMVKLAGDQGAEFSTLAGATVRSVSQGVLGVAVIQALAAGVGMLLVGVPGAGLWALLILGLAIVQLPPAPVLLPVIIYVFNTNDTLPAVLFMIWGIVVSISDAPLKAKLLGRGMKVPTLVIFIGVIGGFMLSGFVGLFTGSVIFVLGYTLFMTWLDTAEDVVPDDGAAS